MAVIGGTFIGEKPNSVQGPMAQMIASSTINGMSNAEDRSYKQAHLDLQNAYLMGKEQLNKMEATYGPAIYQPIQTDDPPDLVIAKKTAIGLLAQNANIAGQWTGGAMGKDEVLGLYNAERAALPTPEQRARFTEYRLGYKPIIPDPVTEKGTEDNRTGFNTGTTTTSAGGGNTGVYSYLSSDPTAKSGTSFVINGNRGRPIVAGNYSSFSDFAPELNAFVGVMGQVGNNAAWQKDNSANIAGMGKVVGEMAAKDPIGAAKFYLANPESSLRGVLPASTVVNSLLSKNQFGALPIVDQMNLFNRADASTRQSIHAWVTSNSKSMTKEQIDAWNKVFADASPSTVVDPTKASGIVMTANDGRTASTTGATPGSLSDPAVIAAANKAWDLRNLEGGTAGNQNSSALKSALGFAQGKSYGQMTPSGQVTPIEIQQYEKRTGDVHFPAMIGVKEGVVNARAMENGGAALVDALNQRYPAMQQAQANRMRAQRWFAGGTASTPANSAAQTAATQSATYAEAALVEPDPKKQAVLTAKSMESLTAARLAASKTPQYQQWQTTEYKNFQNYYMTAGQRQLTAAGLGNVAEAADREERLKIAQEQNKIDWERIALGKDQNKIAWANWGLDRDRLNFAREELAARAQAQQDSIAFGERSLAQKAVYDAVGTMMNRFVVDGKYNEEAAAQYLKDNPYLKTAMEHMGLSMGDLFKIDVKDPVSQSVAGWFNIPYTVTTPASVVANPGYIDANGNIVYAEGNTNTSAAGGGNTGTTQGSSNGYGAEASGFYGAATGTTPPSGETGAVPTTIDNRPIVSFPGRRMNTGGNNGTLNTITTGRP